MRDYMLTFRLRFESMDDATARAEANKVKKEIQAALDRHEAEQKLQEVHQGKAPRKVNW